MSLSQAENQGIMTWMDPDLLNIYYYKVKALAIHPDIVRKEAKNLNIVYTPLFGAGNVPVRRIFKGYRN